MQSGEVVQKSTANNKSLCEQEKSIYILHDHFVPCHVSVGLNLHENVLHSKQSHGTRF